jgi:hypothetical protein
VWVPVALTPAAASAFGDVVIMLDEPGDQPANPSRCERLGKFSMRFLLVALPVLFLNGGHFGCYRSRDPRERDRAPEARGDGPGFVTKADQRGYVASVSTAFLGFSFISSLCFWRIRLQ